jgi:hypothetical protein
MTYFESVFIMIGWYFGAISAAAITAQISPTWFDCVFPGILSAAFLWLFSPNQIPLPHLASSFPLLKHAPSVYIVTLGRSLSWMRAWWWVAGTLEILSGSVNILKHSARFVLLVIDGLKVISSFVSLAISFLAFHVAVSERLSIGGGLSSGFSFGVICCSLTNTSCAQAWGFRQLDLLSVMQSSHWQYADGLCCSVAAFLILFDVRRRSATVVALCFLIRHLVAIPCRGLYCAATWYQAGSWALRWGVRRIAARLVLCFFAILSILLMSLLIFSLA